MSCYEIELLLDEYVDDSLNTERRASVERHLAECADCRRVTDELHSLVETAQKLPRGVVPGRDLLPGIVERIERDGLASTIDRAPRRRIPWIGIAAAWLVISVAAAMALMLRGVPDSASPVGTTADETRLARADGGETMDAVVLDYEQAAEQLLASIHERRDTFSPETLAVLEKNLEIIDRAIGEVQATLAAAPRSRGNAAVFVAMHQQKVELLQRVSRLSSLISI